MNVSEHMEKHGLADEALDAMAEPYESGDYPHEDGLVHSGSHLDAVGGKRVAVVYPSERIPIAEESTQTSSGV